MRSIMIVMGTRPEAIKLCPLVRELKRRRRFKVPVCSTGQHRSMLQSATQAFSVVPDFELDTMRKGQSSAALAARILRGMDALLVAEKPDLLLVQGDTTSAFAAAQAAFYQGIPIGHVEAGLRTYQMHSPFPEELHRREIALLADWHFAPTVTAKKNLVREGIPESTVIITGNTVVDALRFSLEEGIPAVQWEIPTDKRLILFTAHRREHSDETLDGMFRALRRIVDANPDVTAVCPVHQSPRVKSVAERFLKEVPRIQLISPPDTVSFHRLMAQSYLILTDSGGIQEEAVALGIPTVVMRYSSERNEGMRAGVLKLAGSGEEGIFAVADRLLMPESEEYRAMRKPSSVFGDGHACRRIADVLERVLL